MSNSDDARAFPSGDDLWRRPAGGQTGPATPAPQPASVPAPSLAPASQSSDEQSVLPGGEVEAVAAERRARRRGDRRAAGVPAAPTRARPRADRLSALSARPGARARIGARSAEAALGLALRPVRRRGRPGPARPCADARRRPGGESRGNRGHGPGRHGRTELAGASDRPRSRLVESPAQGAAAHERDGPPLHGGRRWRHPPGSNADGCTARPPPTPSRPSPGAPSSRFRPSPWRRTSSATTSTGLRNSSTAIRSRRSNPSSIRSSRSSRSRSSARRSWATDTIAGYVVRGRDQGGNLGLVGLTIRVRNGQVVAQ